MDGRAITAFPSTRRQTRQFTDVTYHRTFTKADERANAFKPFIFGNTVPRPFTTIGAPRRSTAEPPPNFSWVDKGWLAACATPTSQSHYKYLFESGIRHLVSLMKQKPQGALDCVQLPKLNRLKIRIDDYCAPTVNQIRQFIKIVEDANDRKEAVAVHCANGQGRSGTMVACYLVKTKRIAAKCALGEIRKLRPGSVESPEQERVIEQFYQHVKIGKY